MDRLEDGIMQLEGRVRDNDDKDEQDDYRRFFLEQIENRSNLSTRKTNSFVFALTSEWTARASRNPTTGVRPVTRFFMKA